MGRPTDPKLKAADFQLLSFIGAVLLLDEDEGQYVMFAFLVCIIVVSTVFTFPLSLLLGLGELSDVAHLVNDLRPQFR